MHIRAILLLMLSSFAGLCVADTSRPNIIYILADDLGIGDVGAFNPDCKIATPNMNALAANGMRFTDAHSGSAVCTPTRYGVLTGRYSWRTRLQAGVCWGYSLPLISEDRTTVASLLKENGYRTGCVGKWHLGLQWALKDPTKVPSDDSKESWENIDFAKPIQSGPNELGFDYFYGISASLDMHPHVYIENHNLTSTATKVIDASGGMKFWRKGPIGEDFRHIDVLGRLTEKATSFIEESSDEPFFLYFPLPAPHKPIIPSDDFQNKSGLNPWGDFVMQVDATIGSVMQSLEKKGIAKNTLVIVTSDNGATPGADFPALAKKGHDPSYIYRGHKADIFEAGHRVAFIAHWPAAIKSGTKCNETICQTDLLATAAEIVGQELPANAGEDSASLIPHMKGLNVKATRAGIVHHSVNGSFAIRRGHWKLILCPGSGGWSSPRPPEAKKKKLPLMQLYNLKADPSETKNLVDAEPETVKQLLALMNSYVENGRSVPGAPQKNDSAVKLVK